MEIYNKPLGGIGFIIGMVGAYLNYFHIDNWWLKMTLMLIGTIMMLLSFRKPKGKSDNVN